jgi:citrate lyase beta subunit
MVPRSSLFVPARARRVVDATGRSGGAGIAVEGKWVDKPVLLRAGALLRPGEGSG